MHLENGDAAGRGARLRAVGILECFGWMDREGVVRMMDVLAG